MHGFLQSANPFAVNYAHLKNSPFPARGQVLRHKFFHIARAEGVQVKYTVDGHFHGFVHVRTLAAAANASTLCFDLIRPFRAITWRIATAIMQSSTARPKKSRRNAACRIEPMAAGDYDEVMLLWRACEGVGLNESDTRPRIAAYLKRNPGLSLVARANGAIIGAILCGHDGRRGYLHHLAVAPEHRRCGLGGKLVRACLAQLRRGGILKCNIFLYADNAKGEVFWQRLGFTVRPDVKFFQRPLTLAGSKPDRR